MFKLIKLKSFYNPYYVDIGNNIYKVNTISLFNKEGIVIKQDRGWFGFNNNIPEMVINTKYDIKRKLKVDYSVNHPFIVKNNEMVFAEGAYDVYIPVADVAPLEIEYNKELNYIKKVVSAKNVKGMVFEYIVKWLDTEKSGYETRIRFLTDKLSKPFLYKNNIEKVEEMIEELHDLYKKVDVENKKIEVYTIDDYIKDLMDGYEEPKII